jgi:hypothetical protein
MAELEDQSLRQRQGSDSELNKLLFWKERQAMFPTLEPVAEDFLAAAASAPSKSVFQHLRQFSFIVLVIQYNNWLPVRYVLMRNTCYATSIAYAGINQ